MVRLYGTVILACCDFPAGRRRSAFCHRSAGCIPWNLRVSAPRAVAALVVSRGATNEGVVSRSLPTRAVAPRQVHPVRAELVAVLSRVPERHVLEVERLHFVSFSLQEGTAVGYATGAGRKHGWVVAVELTPLVSLVRIALFLRRADGTDWVDPRCIQPFEISTTPREILDAVTRQREIDRWHESRNRSIRDQEILLASGSLNPLRIRRVAAGQDPQFRPWSW